MPEVTATAEQVVPDAFRKVTAKMQDAIEKGQRSARLNAYALVDAMLDVADEIDPQ